MIISIDQRLVIAASLIWETFTDKDAQDFYWQETLAVTVRINKAISTVQTLIKFLLTLPNWLQLQDYEEVEQYQMALPAAPALKLLPMAQLNLEATGPYDSQVDGEPTAVLAFIVTSPPTPQRLLPPVKAEQVPTPKRKSKQSTTKRKTRTRTKAKAEAD